MLDKDLCQGHAVCVGEAPEIFCIGDDGKVALRSPELTAELTAEQLPLVRTAAKFCPTRAIRLSDAT
jgi:sterol 14-demethylase